MKNPHLSEVPRLKVKDNSHLTPCLRSSCRVGGSDAAQCVSETNFDAKAIARAGKFMRGARVCVEGSVKLDRWTGQDGTERTGLSCMSRHVRVAAIGDNRPKRESKPADFRIDPKIQGAADLNDECPF
jgi:single-stranded DNA-binding protein